MRTRDKQFGGFGDVTYDRGPYCVIGERLRIGRLVLVRPCVRHDAFNAFEDATTLRAHASSIVAPSARCRGRLQRRHLHRVRGVVRFAG
jgi:hypothetical protein